MSCVHLQQLFELCDRENLKLSSSDLIHIVCQQCGRQEVCPSLLSEHLPEGEEPPKEAKQPTGGSGQ